MIIKIGEYEIDIKAKEGKSKNFNKADTQQFLNELVFVYFNASVRQKTDGFAYHAQDYNAKAIQIGEALTADNFYNK